VPAVNFNEAPCSWFGANHPARILVKFHEIPIFGWRLNGAISTELAEFDLFLFFFFKPKSCGLNHNFCPLLAAEIVVPTYHTCIATWETIDAFTSKFSQFTPWHLGSSEQPC
jgi:hypothetical protein